MLTINTGLKDRLCCVICRPNVQCMVKLQILGRSFQFKRKIQDKNQPKLRLIILFA